MTMSRRFLVVFVLFLSFFRLSAQLREDSIPLNIADAEQRFINKNLSLIINRFNVDIAKANYLQAKLWYNPNLYFGTTLYNTQTNKWLSDAYPQPGAATIYDQTFQLQQLLTLAGRHKATWKLA
jgi:cobalt-zinc-cadmium efflux system outer membrane protein